jgi:hypothetical protein
VQQAAQRTRKQLGYNKLKFARMAVALLGVACGGLALALYKSWAEQARLAAMLTKRECELSRLVSWTDSLAACWAAINKPQKQPVALCTAAAAGAPRMHVLRACFDFVRLSAAAPLCIGRLPPFLRSVCRHQLHALTQTLQFPGAPA